MTAPSFADEFPEYSEAEAQLCAAGGHFEIARESVLGAPTDVFKKRQASLRVMLEKSARYGDAEYIVCEETRITFRQHLSLVGSVARALEESYGVKKGDRVAILAANCPEWILAWWATVSLGAIAVGMNGWWVRDEIEFALNDCEPKLLLADSQRLARLDRANLAVPNLEIETEFTQLSEFAPGADLSETPIDEDDPACILYTSGTTGRPKGVINTHRGILAVQRLQVFTGVRSAMVQQARAQGRPDDALLQTASAPTHEPAAKPSEAGTVPGPPSPGTRGRKPDDGTNKSADSAGRKNSDKAGSAPRNSMLINAPLFHLTGLYSAAVAFLGNGLKSVWQKGRFDPERVMQIIESEQIMSWAPMGTMLFRVASHPNVGKYDLSSIRRLGTGAAPMNANFLDRMKEVFPNAQGSLSLGYGLTEATGTQTLCGADMLTTHPQSVGPPLPTVNLEIRDADGAVVPTGSEGEIRIKSPTVMAGYWRRPEATAAVLSEDRWLKTGDIGHYADNGFLYIHSRARDMILRGGENVYPPEIEQRLEAHPSVEEAAVFGVDDDEFGQVVKAVIVPTPNTEMDIGQLGNFVGKTLAYFKIPSIWEQRREPLPRNAMGKVLKDMLRDKTQLAQFLEE